MIYGIGTDIVEIDRIRVALQRHGRRFAARILHPDELAEFDAALNPAHYLAKRFAAKEAAVKAMGLGFRNGITLKQVWVVRDALGKPALSFASAAKTSLQTAGVTSAHVSLSDENKYALAFVVLERGDARK